MADVRRATLGFPTLIKTARSEVPVRFLMVSGVVTGSHGESRTERERERERERESRGTFESLLNHFESI